MALVVIHGNNRVESSIDRLWHESIDWQRTHNMDAHPLCDCDSRADNRLFFYTESTAFSCMRVEGSNSDAGLGIDSEGVSNASKNVVCKTNLFVDRFDA